MLMHEKKSHAPFMFPLPCVFVVVTQGSDGKQANTHTSLLGFPFQDPRGTGQALSNSN